MAQNSLDIFGSCPACGMKWSYMFEGAQYSHIINVYNDVTDVGPYYECPGCRARWSKETKERIHVEKEPRGV